MTQGEPNLDIDIGDSTWPLEQAGVGRALQAFQPSQDHLFVSPQVKAQNQAGQEAESEKPTSSTDWVISNSGFRFHTY